MQDYLIKKGVESRYVAIIHDNNCSSINVKNDSITAVNSGYSKKSDGKKSPGFLCGDSGSIQKTDRLKNCNNNPMMDDDTHEPPKAKKFNDDEFPEGGKKLKKSKKSKKSKKYFKRKSVKKRKMAKKKSLKKRR
jgi:hypothetical protein